MQENQEVIEEEIYYYQVMEHSKDWNNDDKEEVFDHIKGTEESANAHIRKLNQYEVNAFRKKKLDTIAMQLKEISRDFSRIKAMEALGDHDLGLLGLNLVEIQNRIKRDLNNLDSNLIMLDNFGKTINKDTGSSYRLDKSYSLEEVIFSAV